jgi:endonuclease/exonuclease/phosphatase family metal-dependent hydrolase
MKSIVSGAKPDQVALLHKTIMKLPAILLSLLTALRVFAETNAEPPLCLASYNLRYASSAPPNAWSQRRPLVAEVIHGISPDVLGTQEGLHDQLRDIAADLPEYEWLGRGRDGGDRGEFMAIFYRKDRLEALSTNHFWLSDTPEVVASTTWGNKNRRMVSYVKFRDRQTNREFYFFNTHFDHEVQLARDKSAELVRARVAALSTNLPIILTGDFNAAAGNNKAYTILTADNFFQDTWIKAPVRRGEGFGTFNGFKSMPADGERIDWILTRGDVKVEAAEIVTTKPNNQWASDHFPIVARLRLVN